MNVDLTQNYAGKIMMMEHMMCPLNTYNIKKIGTRANLLSSSGGGGGDSGTMIMEHNFWSSSLRFKNTIVPLGGRGGCAIMVLWTNDVSLSGQTVISPFRKNH